MHLCCCSTSTILFILCCCALEHYSSSQPREQGPKTENNIIDSTHYFSFVPQKQTNKQTNKQKPQISIVLRCRLTFALASVAPAPQRAAHSTGSLMEFDSFMETLKAISSLHEPKAQEALARCVWDAWALERKGWEFERKGLSAERDSLRNAFVEGLANNKMFMGNKHKIIAEDKDKTIAHKDKIIEMKEEIIASVHERLADAEVNLLMLQAKEMSVYSIPSWSWPFRLVFYRKTPTARRRSDNRRCWDVLVTTVKGHPRRVRRERRGTGEGGTRCKPAEAYLKSTPLSHSLSSYYAPDWICPRWPCTDSVCNSSRAAEATRDLLQCSLPATRSRKKCFCWTTMTW